MKTSEIISKLKDNYYKINKNNEQCLVINKEWQSINNEKLKIIVVGDNPGEKEKEDCIYFHPEGTAGSKAREFLARYYKDDEIIFINKCPFYSPTTNELMINEQSKDAINMSLFYTVQAIKELLINSKVKVLITGCTSNKLNRRFYRLLFKELKDWKDRKNLFFSKHFSRNHFKSQLDIVASKDINEILSEIKKVTSVILDKHYKSYMN